MRPIDADATTKTYTADMFDTLDDFERVNDILEYAPTIDAIPVIHAHWDEYQTPPMICCSNCDWGTDPQEKFFKYCPMCGADMRGDDK